MDKLPKYATELIAWLDAEVGHLDFTGLGPEAWGDMDQSNVRRMAYWAGQRALVDALVSMVEEDEDAARNDTDSSVVGVVLGPDGKLHRGVSPVHVAPDSPRSDPKQSDGDDQAG